MGILNAGIIGGTSLGGGGSSNSQLALSDGLACFTQSFSGVSTLSITHGLGTEYVVVEFKDASKNLLVPNNWQVINSNRIDVDFGGTQQGDVTIIGCIESGLSPITGGVTLLEGLSGIIDLDSPNNSILITTSGQVIQLNAIFTPGSGTLLEYIANNFIPVDAREASGSIIPNTNCRYDLGSELKRWRALYACSGLFDDAVGIGTSDPRYGLHVSGTNAAIQVVADGVGYQALDIAIDASGYSNVEAVHINYDTGARLSGINAAVLVSVNNSGLAETGFTSAFAAVTSSGTPGTTIGLTAGPSVAPILQIVGGQLTSTALTVGLVNAVDRLASFQDPETIDAIFVNNQDTVTIGSNTRFAQITFSLVQVAEKTINPRFEFSVSPGVWQVFTPLDGTNGFQSQGNITWSPETIPGWSPGLGGNFLIRITRRAGNIGAAIVITNQVSIAPITTTVGGTNILFWNQDGDLRVRKAGFQTTTTVNAANAIETSGNIATSGYVNPLDDCTYELGTPSKRWANLNACSGTFEERPTVNGSGVLLVGEAADIFSVTRKAALNFTPESGYVFVLYHGLQTEDFVFSMWSTLEVPQTVMVPTNVYPSGLNHAVIGLDVPTSGRIVFVG